MFKWVLFYQLFCCIYIYLFHYRKKKRWLAQYLIAFFFPILGFVMIYFIDKKVRSKRDSLPEGLHKRKGESEIREKSIYKIDVDKERNIIPIEDALILNEHKIRRTMLLDLLKDESTQNIEALEFALENEDSETSHYAASAVMEIKRKLLNTMQALDRQVDENPNDLQVLVAYSEVIKQYIQSGFLDEKTLLKNQYNYSVILEKVIEIQPNEERYFIEKIKCDLALREYVKARTFCDLFIQLHPLCESAYFLDLQIHYQLQNTDEFQLSLNRLRQSQVTLSPEGLSKLRFWLAGEWV